ncbi:hypothetical protein SLEP1_g21870 [Rubroshorea leprosula]|uniref:Uncharacterized protein n=1 Tax=Rubroshorea leprosula TaxID=152421 RepID=A0AAV5JCT9_9ROSI|nr:hypothetical protein SLEP1_g21870 [Rubroshorea leprosula]
MNQVSPRVPLNTSLGTFLNFLTPNHSYHQGLLAS